MASQHTPPKSNENTVLSSGTFGTPKNRKNGILGNGNSPQPTTPLRSRTIENLKKGSYSFSPKLKIPESPVMQRLGYGTGVGVYLLERSPRLCGELRSPWAIKKTNQVIDTSIDESHDVFAGRIEYEAAILKQLSHPNIIGYRAYGQTSPGTTYLAMEKASQSLADLIEDRVEDVVIGDECDGAGPFPAEKMEKVAMDVANALVYLHEKVRMVHGDIKAANVLVFGEFETIKLCDFGVARRLAKDGTVEGTYVGTEIWCPMEVIKQKRRQEHVPITHKADIFPFGLTIHEMITLKPPHLASAENSCIKSGTGSSVDNTPDSVKSSNSDESDNDTLMDDSFDELAYEEALQRFVGTRPALPAIEFDSSYTTILGIFYCSTEEDPLKRPDAKDILAALTETGKEN